MKTRGASRRVVLALAIAMAACARHQEPAPTPPAPEPTPTPPPAPTPPPVTINSGLGPEESLWHVRSALNVAALMCGNQAGGADLVGRYNALLTTNKTTLAAAYAAERQRFGTGGPAELDRHSTQLYNFFAKPGSLARFCADAGQVASEMAAMPADALTAAAPGALARLEQAVLAPPPVQPPILARQVAAVAAPLPPASDWRIQLGAFTGQAAAEAAWAKVRAKVPSLASYTPVYEPVPNSRLVRLQVGAANDRQGAISLCASAAAGGFDCLPRVRPVPPTP